MVCENITSELEEYTKNLNNTDPKKIIYEVLCNLKSSLEKEGEIFLSEVDFQFSFAKALSEYYQEDKIILEYPIKTEKLYEKACDNCKESFGDKFKTDKSYIDLYFEHKNAEYFIEFKYKTEKIYKGTYKTPEKIYEISRHYNENRFCLASQEAEYIGRYQIYEDVERMENILKINNNSKKRFSFVIFLSNYPKYWEYNQEKNNSSTYNFPLAPISRNCLKSMQESGCALQYQGKINNKIPRNIYVEKPHNINWLSFKSLYHNEIANNREFKVLVIDCNNLIETD